MHRGYKMTRTKESVIALIREAFRDVSLGNGIGLRKAKSLDDYGDGYTRERFELDEKEKAEGWQSLNAEDLDEDDSALSFYDPEGMRFHLPAYMIFDLEDKFERVDMRLHLAYVEDDYSREKFSLLNFEQRNAVCEYLLYVRDQLDEDNYLYEDIETALKLYWSLEYNNNGSQPPQGGEIP